MPVKIEKLEELKELNCINSNEYKNTRNKNLKFKCIECIETEIYTTSLEGRRKQRRQTCKKCSLKPSRDELRSFGVLNPKEYIATKSKNLKFKCVDCDEIYTTSAQIRKAQIRQTCRKCSHIQGSSTKKPTDEELAKWNVLNPKDYIDIREDNLNFKCCDCDEIYTKSLVNRKKQPNQTCMKVWYEKNWC